MKRAGLSLLILMSLSPCLATAAVDTTAAPATSTTAPATATTTTAPAAATVAAPATATAAPAASSMAMPSAAQPGSEPESSNDQSPMTSAASSVPTLPSRGMDMANVEHIYGTPLEKLAPVPIKGTRTHPPITRWIYPTFVVYFEYDHVVHAVTKAHPFKDNASNHS